MGQALELAPEQVALHASMGLICAAVGDRKEAIGHYQYALQHAPGDAEIAFQLGNLFFEVQQYHEAVESYRKSLASRPGHAASLNNLGKSLQALGRLDEADAAYQNAIRIDRGFADAYFNRGTLCREQGYLETAQRCFHEVLRLSPNDAAAYNNLGTLAKDLGHHEEAVDSYRRALQLAPERVDIHSNLLFVQSYNLMLAPQSLLEAHREWDWQHTFPEHQRYHHQPTGKPEKRLRIAYLSPDFRRHPVSVFFEPLLASHDRRDVEIFCYAELAQPDEVTTRLQQQADNWCFINGHSDEQVARMIHEDGIDILVDLAGHTAGNRLRVFTCKPAPIQASYLGYCATTGLTAMDYWISDTVLTPNDSPEQATETLIRLPRCWLCYQPPTDAPAVSVRGGTGEQITLGSFNHLAKLTPEVIALWSRILRQLPHADLLLKTQQLADPAMREETTTHFAAEGITAERLQLLPASADYLQDYGVVDIALDPFPRTGGATTVDALWMGVPVITLAGERFIARQGASLLGAVGLDSLVATGPDDYVNKAVELAQNHSYRQQLRQKLRDRMTHSELCDGPGLAQALETCYRAMWKTYLEKN